MADVRQSIRDKPLEKRTSRSRLRDFYGIDASNSSIAPVAETITEEQPTTTFTAPTLSVAGSIDAEHGHTHSRESSQLPSTNLNSKNFDQQKYIHVLLQESSLPVLMKTHIDLVQDIRNLDGDMKTLVYENYEKFISAADTIKKMKSNIVGMEEQLAKLDANIKKITDNSSEVSKSFVEKKKTISDLGRRHVLLKKLEFIFQLPQQITAAVKQERYIDACLLYFKTNSILERYRDLAVFAKLEGECVSLVNNLVIPGLKKRLENPSRVEDAVYCSACLMALKHFTSFKDCWNTMITKALDYISKSSTDLLSQQIVETEEHAKVVKVKKLNHIFLNSLGRFLELFHESILSSNHHKSSESSGNTGISNTDTKLFVFFLPADMLKEAKSDLEQFIRRLTSNYYAAVETVIKTVSGDALSDLEQNVLVVDAFYVDINQLASASTIVKSNLLTRCNNLVEVLLASLVNRAFESKRKILWDKLLYVISGSVDEFRGNLAAFMKYFNESLFAEIVRDVQVIKNSSCKVVSEYQDSLLNGISRELKEFWLNLLNDMQKHSKGQSFKIRGDGSQNNNQRTACVVLMGKLCAFIHKYSIQDSFRFIILEDASFIEAVSNDSVRSDVAFLKEKYQKTKNLLLTRFVDLASGELSHIVRQYVETCDWLNASAPNGPSKCWEQIYESLEKLDSDLSVVFDVVEKLSNTEEVKSEAHESNSNISSNEMTTHSTNSNALKSQASLQGMISYTMTNSSTKLASKFANSSFPGINTLGKLNNHITSPNIDKLFSEKITFFGVTPVESRLGCLLGIIMIVLKAFVEVSR